VRRALLAILPWLFAGACVGQTGGDTFRFPVAAAGPPDAVTGQPLAFTSGGWSVVLTKAVLHVGAVYLDESRPNSGGQATGCYLTGTYLAQETSPLDVDLLDSTPQPFPDPALGVTTPPALVGQVWLTGGDINAADDTTPILVVSGTATKNGGAVPFAGTITIGSNRETSSSGAAGGDPICKKRIVSPILLPGVPALEQTGGLLLRVDPRLFFVGVDFSALPADAVTGGYAFSDDPSAPGYQPTGYLLFYNLTSTAPYAFSWNGAL
jgi:hypothetical protein